MIQSYSCRAGLCVGFYDNDGGILCQTNQSSFIMKHISIIVPLGQSSLVNIEVSWLARKFKNRSLFFVTQWAQRSGY